jgi:hypothetical protein
MFGLVLPSRIINILLQFRLCAFELLEFFLPRSLFQEPLLAASFHLHFEGIESLLPLFFSLLERGQQGAGAVLVDFSSARLHCHLCAVPGGV